MAFRRFNHLNVPEHWEQYWSKYPNGYTILEALIDWVSQVDSMSDNLTEWNIYLEKFVEQFDENLQKEVVTMLNEWLADGTLAQVINDEVFNMKADKVDLIAFEEELNIKLTEWVATVNAQFETFSTDMDTKFDGLEEIVKQTISNVVPFAKYNPDPTGVNDSYAQLQLALDELEDNETLLLEPNATYRISDEIKSIKTGIVSIDGNNSTINSEVIVTNQDVNGRALDFQGVFKVNKDMTAALTKGTNTVMLNSTADIKVGDLVFFSSTEQFNSSRDYYKKGGTFSVTEILTASSIRISGSFPYDMSNATVKVYSPITVRIKNLTVVAKNALPSGRFGIHILYAINSSLDNVFVDNFNHCYHLRTHYNTVVNNIRSGRSYFEGSQESYGLASYMGTFLRITNSSFHSGRHALEISGFENSFKTTIINTYASGESDLIGFNTHQSCYDLVAINCIFDKIGLSNKATLINCFLGDSGSKGSNIKTSEKYENTAFVFSGCEFSDTFRIQTTNDAQNKDTTAKYIGLLLFENCTVKTRVQLNLSVSETWYDKIQIRNTDNVGISSFQNSARINHLLYEDSTWNADATMIVQGTDYSSIIDNIRFVRCSIRNRYNVINLRRFNNLLFDSCVSLNFDDGNPVYGITSKSDVDTTIGLVTFINTKFIRMTMNTGGFSHLVLISSDIIIGNYKSSIGTTQRTTLETF